MITLSRGELTKTLAQSVTRQVVLKKFSVALAGLTMAVFLSVPFTLAAGQKAGTSAIFDPAGDAVFPFDLYGAPVPPYIDVVRASVSCSRGVFHFEIQVSTEIPANADPAFSPSVNHLGATFGLLTDPATAESPISFFGHQDHYALNYYLGALYSVGDSGAGLGLGWHGFLIDLSTFTVVEISLQIRKDTFILEIPAASIGNPASINWLVGSECDPVTIPEEKRKGAVLVDFAPDGGYATWTAQ